MTDLLKDLEAVALLADKATPGEWAASIGHHVKQIGGVIVADPCERRGPQAQHNAEYIAALSNLFRTHHAEIAEAVKDARRYRMTRHKLTCGKLTVDEELSIIGAKDGQAFDATIDAMHNSAREAGE